MNAQPKMTFAKDRFWLRGVDSHDGWQKHVTSGYLTTPDPYIALQAALSGDVELTEQATKELKSLQLWYKLSGSVKMRPQGLKVPSGKSIPPYQEVGAYFLIHQPRAYMADDPGAGKTVMCCVALMNTVHPIKTGTIICPKNALYVWQEHLKDWCGIDAKIILKNDEEPADFIIMTYARSKTYNRHRRGDVLIVDEAAKVKNDRAKQTQVILGELVPMHKRAWLLSGTPIPNGRPIELWPVLRALQPHGFQGMDMRKFPFARRYCRLHKGRWGWDMNGAARLPDLHARLRAGFMVRRRLPAILPQLPPLSQTIVPVAGDAALLKLEAPYRKEYLSTGKLPKVKDAGELAEIRHRMGRAMVPAAVDAIETLLEDGQQVVVFCHHLDVMRAIQEKLPPGVAEIIDGSVSAPRRNDMNKRFQAGDIRVLILNAAGQEAITLTAASNVILVEADWVPGNNEQRIGRCWRFGQKATHVTAQYLVMRGSMGEVILRRNIDKDANIRETIDG